MTRVLYIFIFELVNLYKTHYKICENHVTFLAMPDCGRPILDFIKENPEKSEYVAGQLLNYLNENKRKRIHIFCYLLSEVLIFRQAVPEYKNFEKVHKIRKTDLK